MTTLQQLGDYIKPSQPLSGPERQQATRFIAGAAQAIMLELPNLQIFAWDPDSKECKEAVTEMASKADLIIQLARFLYAEKG
jgi:hypothetical protein